MPSRHGPWYSNWDCHVCGISDNQGWRARCRICDAYPKPEARRLLGGGAKGKGGKGGVGEGKGQGKSKGTEGKSGGSSGKGGDALGAYATRQLQQQRAQSARAAHRSSERELADARRRNSSLQDDIQRLQQELADARKKKPAAMDDGDDMDMHAPEDYSEENRKERMDKIRGSLPYLEEQFGTDSALYQEAAEELDAHQKALREAKPYRTHRTILERKVDKLRKAREKDGERLAELKDAAEEIQAKIQNTEMAIKDRDREIEAAEAELRSLVLRAVGEEAAGPPQQAVDPTVGWQSVIQTVGRLASQPGVPEQFAAQLDGLFGQLQYMVSVLSTHAAAAGTAPVPGGAADGRSYAEAAAASSNKPGESLPSGMDERHQRQQSWRQRRQTEAISSFIESYRAEQRQQPPQQQVLGCDAQQQQQPPQQQLQQAPTSFNSADDAIAWAAQQQQQQQQQQLVASVIGAAVDGGSNPQVEVAEAARVEAAATAATALEGTAGSSMQTPTAQEAAADDVADDGESDITGTLSETERDEMDIEAVMSKVPTEQRASVRAILEVRKARMAKRFQRLKKPTGSDAAAPRTTGKR